MNLLLQNQSSTCDRNICIAVFYCVIVNNSDWSTDRTCADSDSPAVYSGAADIELLLLQSPRALKLTRFNLQQSHNWSLLFRSHVDTNTRLPKTHSTGTKGNTWCVFYYLCITTKPTTLEIFNKKCNLWSGLPRRNINSAIFAEMYIFIIQESLCQTFLFVI